MLGQHLIEFDVSDLVAVQGEEGLIVNVTAYSEPKSLAGSSHYGVDAVLYFHAKACSISKEIDYLLLQICNPNHYVRHPVCSEPLDDPL